MVVAAAAVVAAAVVGVGAAAGDYDDVGSDDYDVGGQF